MRKNFVKIKVELLQETKLRSPKNVQKSFTAFIVAEVIMRGYEFKRKVLQNVLQRENKG